MPLLTPAGRLAQTEANRQKLNALKETAKAQKVSRGITGQFNLKTAGYMKPMSAERKAALDAHFGKK